MGAQRAQHAITVPDDELTVGSGKVHVDLAAHQCCKNANGVEQQA